MRRDVNKDISRLYLAKHQHTHANLSTKLPTCRQSHVHGSTFNPRYRCCRLLPPSSCHACDCSAVICINRRIMHFYRFVSVLALHAPGWAAHGVVWSGYCFCFMYQIADTSACHRARSLGYCDIDFTVFEPHWLAMTIVSLALRLALTHFLILTLTLTLTLTRTSPLPSLHSLPPSLILDMNRTMNKKNGNKLVFVAVILCML